MGNFSSNTNNSQNFSDDSEDDGEYRPGRRDLESNDNMALDALHHGDKLEMVLQEEKIKKNTSNSFQRNTLDCVNIPIELILEIEKELNFLDKVSLVFLLYDDCTAATALEYLRKVELGADINVLQEWVHYSKDKECWKLKLLEALSITQNYRALKKMGCVKLQADKRYLPACQDYSLCVNLSRKKLYLIFDNLSSSQRDKFLSFVEKDFKQKKLKFIKYKPICIEMFFLYWITINYIKTEDLSMIKRALNFLELSEAAESLNGDDDNSSVQENSNNFSTAAEASLNQGMSSTSLSRSSTYSSANSSISQDKINNSYYINSNHAGLCLIINQKNFYIEFDPEFKHLVPNSMEQLEPRRGTDLDRDKLKNTFEKFGYTVIIENDQTHVEMQQKIINVIEQVQSIHCSLIICILSHGEKGKIYGVNSIPVNIESIKNFMCRTNFENLKGKPKILILQSCQGTVCQEVVQEKPENEMDQFCMDGPLGSIPATADVLVFYATVPGFGAVRDKKNGSWFIQTFCDIILEKYEELHLDEICTLVKQNVINKKWVTETAIKAMVPLKESTLSKFLYFHQKC